MGLKIAFAPNIIKYKKSIVTEKTLNSYKTFMKRAEP